MNGTATPVRHRHTKRTRRRGSAGWERRAGSLQSIAPAAARPRGGRAGRGGPISPMVGSWSSGKRWLMNCIVMAAREKALSAHRPAGDAAPAAARRGAELRPHGAAGTARPHSPPGPPGPHAPLFPTPPAPNITSLYSRGCPAPPGRAPASISSAPSEAPPLRGEENGVSPAALRAAPPLRSAPRSPQAAPRRISRRRRRRTARRGAQAATPKWRRGRATERPPRAKPRPPIT